MKDGEILRNWLIRNNIDEQEISNKFGVTIRQVYKYYESETLSKGVRRKFIEHFGIDIALNDPSLNVHKQSEVKSSEVGSFRTSKTSHLIASAKEVNIFAVIDEINIGVIRKSFIVLDEKMNPSLFKGDAIQCTKVAPSDIRANGIYCIKTKDVYIVFRPLWRDGLVLTYDNPDYDSRPCDLDDIQESWRCSGRFTTKIGSGNSLSDRIARLEAIVYNKYSP